MLTYRITKDAIVGDAANGNGYEYVEGQLVTPTTYEEMLVLEGMTNFGCAVLESVS